MESRFSDLFTVLGRLKDRPKYIFVASPQVVSMRLLDPPLSMVDRPDLPVVLDAQKVDDNRLSRPSCVEER